MTSIRTGGIAGDIGPRRRPSALPTPSVPAPIPTAPVVAKKSVSRRRRWLRWWGEAVQYPLIAAVALGAAYSSAIGQWFIFGYVVIALCLRRTSRLSFGLALMILAAIPLFGFLRQSGIAQNAGVYVYELLLFGTAQALWEHRKIAKTPK